MSSTTKIEWTEATWNPLRGCTRISAGCQNCYAERLAAIRLSGPGQPYESLAKMTQQGPRWTNEIQLVHEQLELPLHWKRPRMIFVNSMSDLFHEKVPLEYIQKVFEIMRKASWHTFQVLTKRSHRLVELNDQIAWPSNVWMGVSVENKDCLFRIEHLKKTSAKTKFLSLEPLLGPLGNLDLQGIDWVVVGGESGPNARPMLESWVKEIHQQCKLYQVAFFFKQWGGLHKKQNGRIFCGRTWDEMPTDVPKVWSISKKRRWVFQKAYQYLKEWSLHLWNAFPSSLEEEPLSKRDIWAQCLRMAWNEIKTGYQAMEQVFLPFEENVLPV